MSQEKGLKKGPKIEAGGSHTLNVPTGMEELVWAFLKEAGVTDYTLVLGQAIAGRAQHKGRVNVVRTTNGSVVVADQTGDNTTRREIIVRVAPDKIEATAKLIRKRETELMLARRIVRKQKVSKPVVVKEAPAQSPSSAELAERTMRELAAMAIEEEVGKAVISVDRCKETIIAICTSAENEADADAIIVDLVEQCRIQPVFDKMEVVGYQLVGQSQRAVAINQQLARLSALAQHHQSVVEVSAPTVTAMAELRQCKETLLAELEAVDRSLSEHEEAMVPYTPILNSEEHKSAAETLAKVEELLRT